MRPIIIAPSACKLRIMGASMSDQMLKRFDTIAGGMAFLINIDFNGHRHAMQTPLGLNNLSRSGHAVCLICKNTTTAFSDGLTSSILASTDSTTSVAEIVSACVAVAISCAVHFHSGLAGGILSP